jgi:hypothetical protein
MTQPAEDRPRVHQHYVLSDEPPDEGLARRIAGQFFSPDGAPRHGRGERP